MCDCYEDALPIMVNAILLTWTFERFTLNEWGYSVRVLEGTRIVALKVKLRETALLRKNMKYIF